MKLLIGVAAAGVCAMLWASPASALRPAPLGVPALSVSEASPAQFRFPWEAKPQRRKPRQKRAAKPRQERALAAERRRGREPQAPAAIADPKNRPLPALVAPLGALPRGGTEREAEGWAALAALVGPPAPVQLLPPEGPAPAPANVVALLAALQRPPEPERPSRTARTEAPGPAATDDDEPETPDVHVPLPPVRPGSETAARPPEPAPAPDAAAAPDAVPLPQPRDQRSAALEPGAPLPPEPPPGPTPPAIPLPVTSHEDDPACAALADESFAVAEQIPPIEGPGVCGGGPLVLLTGVKRKDGGLIAVKPVATLRCAMAKELADYLRDDLAPAAEKSGAALARLEIAGSFMCRGRNGASGGRMSEHGRANAVDLSGFGLSDGKSYGVFASDLPEPLKTAAKAGACAHFDTVLGPGSDGFHETHLHIDLQPRRSKAKLCQWSDPEVAKAGEEDRREAEPSAGAKDAASAKGDDAERRAGGARPTRRPDGGRDGKDDRRAPAREDEPLPKPDKAP